MKYKAALVKFGLGIGDYRFEDNPSEFPVPHIGDVFTIYTGGDGLCSVEEPLYRPDGSRMYGDFIDLQSFKILGEV